MELLVWTHTYNIGNELVDNQHKKLMHLINTLYDIQSGQKEDSQVQKVFQELVDYTVYHFQSEEELFQKHNYPEYQHHKQIHEQLVQEVAQYASAYEGGDAALKEKLMLFLTDWLKDHILGEDKKFGRFLQEQQQSVEEDDL